MKRTGTITRGLLGGGLALLLVFAFVPKAGAQSCVPPPSGLVSWWPGDVDASDIQDGNAGVLTNGALAGVAGKVDGAFSFDGDNDVVSIGDNNNLDITSELTIDAWVFPTMVTDIRSIVIKDSSLAGGRSYALTMGFPNDQKASWFVAKTDSSFT